MGVAWPLIISTGSFTVMQFCDRMFLAWHSPISIQAALPAGILAFTFICGFTAVAGYTNTFVAQFWGSGDGPACARVTAQGIFLALASWPLMAALIPVGHLILALSGHPPEVLAEEKEYFTILMLGGAGSPLAAALVGFFTGRGRTVTSMVAHVSANLTNVLLDYLLIFGHWGFPRMGIRGAALATVAAGFIVPAILAVPYFSRPVRKVFRTVANFRPDRILLMRLLRFGMPAGIQLALDVASFEIFVLLTGRLGHDALAASNIALSINLLAFMPLIGLGIAASILVGQYQGARESDLAARAGWAALHLGWLYMIPIGISFLFLPQSYFALFSAGGPQATPVARLLPIGRRLMVIMAVWGLADAVNLILGGALKGAGDTRFVMYYSIAMAWGVLVPGQVYIVLVKHMDILSSWTWTAFYICAMAIGYFLRFAGGRWQKIDLLGRRRAVVIEPTRPGAEALLGGD